MQVIDGLEDTTPARDRNSATREDKIHGSLLVLSELLRCSNAGWEMVTREIEELSGACPSEEEEGTRHLAGGKVSHNTAVLIIIHNLTPDSVPCSLKKLLLKTLNEILFS